MITVLSPGPLSTVQDLGRPGWGDLGIGRSGAADRFAHIDANMLVGNPENDATIEATLGRLRVRFERDAVVAVSGAGCEVKVAGVVVPMYEVITVVAGQELRLGAPRTGLRTYVAVRGGVDVPPVLGSRATDTLSGIGPPKLAAGMTLPIGEPPSGPAERVLSPPLRRTSGALNGTLTVLPGPREDWFTPDALTTLCSADWTVTVDANRVGARLAGPPLERARSGELPSEPMVAGALQVPPNGQPILFLADHPVTGGYPVIAVLTDADLPAAAQLRPGQSVRFRLR